MTSQEWIADVRDAGGTAGLAVIIPCRNAAPWISEALDSLVEQTRRPDDVVIIDDGSEDGSGRVVAAWLAQHPDAFDAKLLSVRGAGLLAALQAGFAAVADRELVCRLDADDRLPPDYLAALEAALALHPEAGYAYPAMRLFGDTEGLYYTRDFSAASLVFEGNFVCTGALMRRSAYDAAGGVSDLPAWEDWDLWLRFLRAGYEGVLVPEALYEWRRHGASRNTMSWSRRRALRLRIWWRHRQLVARYAAAAAPLLLHRARHRVRQQ